MMPLRRKLLQGGNFMDKVDKLDQIKSNETMKF